MEFGELFSELMNAPVAVGVTIVGAVVALAGLAAQAVAKSGAETAIKNWNWPAELAQALERTRGTERQERRFEAYGQLWKAMRPLAIYDNSPIDPKTTAELTESLSDWYFSERGGLMLTAHVRDFYFALQGLLQNVSAKPNWTAQRPGPVTKLGRPFKAVLRSAGAKDALLTLDYLKTFEESAAEAKPTWPVGAAEHARKWRDDMAKLSKIWFSIKPRSQFAILQQVSSTLRTAMTLDVESRLR